MSDNNNQDYREASREGFRVLGVAAGWWVAIVAFFTIGGAIYWGLSVATAPIQGKGDQYKQINSADNRTFQYQRFFDLDATIRSQSQSAAQAKKDLADFNKQTPQRGDESFSITETRNQMRTVADGLRQQCLSNIQQYNNDAQEFTRNQFLDKNLPEHFNPAACDDPSLLPAAAGGGH